MENLTLERGSSLCLCVDFPIEDKKLESLNKTIYDEIIKISEYHYKEETLVNRVLFHNHYYINQLNVLFHFRQSNYAGFKEYQNEIIKKTTEELKKKKIDESIIEKELEGMKKSRDLLEEQNKDTSGYLLISFDIEDLINSEALIENLKSLRESQILTVIDKSLGKENLFNICLDLVFDIKKYTVLPAYWNLVKTRETNKIDKKIGSFSLKNIEWQIKNSPIGVTGLGIGSYKGNLKIQLKMCYEIKKISVLYDYLKTGLEIINSIIMVNDNDE